MKLIDADELSTVTDIREDGAEFTYIPYSEIEEAPTAYDIDKVVERLEAAKSEIASEAYCKAINVELCVSRNCFECCAEYLIKIVKAGGKDD